MALPGAGGCDFLADPNQRAIDAAVFWRADELASVVVLVTAPAGTGTPSILLADLPDKLMRRDAEDGAHLLISDDAIHHQIWLIDPPSGTTPVVALISLDATARQRADATLRFWRCITHGRPRTLPSPPHRAGRLVSALRALDARLAGASYRAIAETLFDPTRLTAEPWKTSSLRDTVIRLTRTGVAMMRGGYRTLLGPRRPD